MENASAPRGICSWLPGKSGAQLGKTCPWLWDLLCHKLSTVAAPEPLVEEPTWQASRPRFFKSGIQSLAHSGTDELIVNPPLQVTCIDDERGWGDRFGAEMRKPAQTDGADLIAPRASALVARTAANRSEGVHLDVEARRPAEGPFRPELVEVGAVLDDEPDCGRRRHVAALQLQAERNLEHVDEPIGAVTLPLSTAIVDQPLLEDVLQPGVERRRAFKLDAVQPPPTDQRSSRSGRPATPRRLERGCVSRAGRCVFASALRVRVLRSSCSATFRGLRS